MALPQDVEDVCFSKSRLASTAKAPMSCDIGKHRKASTLLLLRERHAWGHAALDFPAREVYGPDAEMRYQGAMWLLTGFALGVIAGILLQKYYSVGRLLHSIGVYTSRGTSSYVPSRSLHERPEIPLTRLASQRVMVALAFGQSNAANFGENPRHAGAGVFNFYQGKLYAAHDPLLGAGGDGGSVWTRLGDQLIAAKHYDTVVFLTLGVGDAALARWTVNGDLHPRLVEAIRDVQSHGLSITHVLWHQGEKDAMLHTSKHAYQQMFMDMVSSIRQHGVTAPLYVSVATRCYKLRAQEEIRQAQQELVDMDKGIYAGPDTDTIGWGYRYDGCHFSDEGLERCAELWLEKLTPHGSSPQERSQSQY
jgi:lysophospholipase L1-like esterase